MREHIIVNQTSADPRRPTNCKGVSHQPHYTTIGLTIELANEKIKNRTTYRNYDQPSANEATIESMIDFAIELTIT